MRSIEIAKSVTRFKDTNEYLLVKRSEEDTNSGKWEFPGGGCKNESPKDAAIRELVEETGLTGETVREGETVEFSAGNTEIKYHPFLIEVSSKEVTLSHEHQDFQWIKLSELEELETLEGLERGLNSLEVAR